MFRNSQRERERDTQIVYWIPPRVPYIRMKTPGIYRESRSPEDFPNIESLSDSQRVHRVQERLRGLPDLWRTSFVWYTYTLMFFFGESFVFFFCVFLAIQLQQHFLIETFLIICPRVGLLLELVAGAIWWCLLYRFFFFFFSSSSLPSLSLAVV